MAKWNIHLDLITHEVYTFEGTKEEAEQAFGRVRLDSPKVSFESKQWVTPAEEETDGE